MKFFVAVLALIALAAGCVGQGGAGADAGNAFLSYVEKSAAANDYMVLYDSNYKVEGGGESVTISGEISMEKHGTDTYFRSSFSAPQTGEKVETRLYNIEGRIYSCTLLAGEEMRCLEGGEVPAEIRMPNPADERQNVQQLLDEGLVRLTSGGRRSIAGYECEIIAVSYDMEKLKERMQAAISQISQKQCYELGSGVPLWMEVQTEMEYGDESFSTYMTATAKEFSQVSGGIKLPEDVQLFNAGIFSNYTLPNNTGAGE